MRHGTVQYTFIIIVDLTDLNHFSFHSIWSKYRRFDIASELTEDAGWNWN